MHASKCIVDHIRVQIANECYNYHVYVLIFSYIAISISQYFLFILRGNLFYIKYSHNFFFNLVLHGYIYFKVVTTPNFIFKKKSVCVKRIRTQSHLRFLFVSLGSFTILTYIYQCMNRKLVR